MSEGFEVLGLISMRGGCLLTEIASELRVPVRSLQGWVDMLCSTGYLKRCSEDQGKCLCSQGACCVSCRSACHEAHTVMQYRLEVTERGKAIIMKRSDVIKTGKAVKDDGRLP